ncbi:hypothetical protein [Thermoactinospora rubra]|uniref:hypothetical protein n=1 Tax=Thermoactinospora rubra TaxID=1088767 RepID=UPI000A10C306|nr:hypothetical protein [Thermoactinospora rubra]
MNYRINFHVSASAEIPGLPAEAWEALIEELLVIGSDPHHRGVPDPDDPNFQEDAFDPAGLVSYVIDDASKVVHVYSIIWAG